MSDLLPSVLSKKTDADAAIIWLHGLGWTTPLNLGSGMSLSPDLRCVCFPSCSSDREGKRWQMVMRAW